MNVEIRFLKELRRRLMVMKKAEQVPRFWPEGCYGSALSWLMFVGPSPGGRRSAARRPARAPTAGRRLWNTDFNEPYAKGATGWLGKYRENIPVLVSTIVGLPLEKGSARLYGFANFDWVPSPREHQVSPARMKQGEKDVLAVLKSSRPQVIAALTQGSYSRLLKCLRREGYSFFFPARQEVCIRIDPQGRAHHRSMDVLKLLGTGRLAGSVVVRLPQHPARMLYGGHGKRCARAVRKAVLQIFRLESVLVIHEP